MRGYEELEAQLDDAIVRTGMNEGGEGQATQLSVAVEEDIPIFYQELRPVGDA